MHATLGRVRSGRITLNEEFGGGRHVFGPPGSDLVADLTIHSPAFYTRLVRDRSVGFAEAYADGLWTAGDLVPLLRIGARELTRLDTVRRRLAPVAHPIQRLAKHRVLNTRRGARRNIAAHYDLGNDLFEAFLDREAMLYSSACFPHEGASLEEAQRTKLERICGKLQLRPDDHLLEIGAGWGGLAIHAARNHGCRVTTTTISREQRSYAEARIRAAGLEDRVTVLGTDYRDLDGAYDKLVSIEMIEAVGWEYFDVYFRRCSELLRPDGLFFLQAICADDRSYEAEKSSRTFASELIFPGGCLPSPEVIARSISRHTDLRMTWLEDISASYALTLAEWRRRFLRAAPQLEAHGYDGRFARIWELWLAFFESGFREARITDLQILFAKPGRRGRVPAAQEPARTSASEPSPSSSAASRAVRVPVRSASRE